VKKILASQVVSRLIWPVIALVLLLAVNAVITPGFLSLEIKDGRVYGHLVDILNQAVPIMLLSVGMTLVIATGGVDLSVGAVLAIGGSFAAYLITGYDMNMPAVLAFTLGLCVVAGAWNGVLVTVFEIQPIVSTLILLVAGRGIAQLITKGQIITFTDKEFSFVGNGYFMGLPFTITIFIIVFAVTTLIMRFTSIRLFIESVGNNITASRYVGIQAGAVLIFVYAFSGLCSGVAGVIVASDIMAADANNAGLYSELDAILAVVIGGTALTGGRFSIIGSVVGALIIQTLTTTIRAQNIPVEYALVFKALAALIVFLLQSNEFRRIFTRRRKT